MGFLVGAGVIACCLVVALAFGATVAYYIGHGLQAKKLVVSWLVALALLALVGLEAYRTFSPAVTVAIDKPTGDTSMSRPAPPPPQVPAGCREVQTGVYACDFAPGEIFDATGHKIGEIQ